MWAPKTEEDLLAALEAGDLRETHTHEMKRELGDTDGARTETARDLASLAIDGGVLIFGLEEDKENRTFLPAPMDLAGKIEALESIAGLRVDPPLTIHPTEIESADGDGSGYIVVVVPPSLSAPHMVQGSYYGRGERRRERLTDAQVLRYHQARRTDGELAETMLRELITADPFPKDLTRNGHLFLVAVPVTAPPRVADALAWNAISVQEVAMSTESHLADVLPRADPSPRALRYALRRARGMAWTSASPREQNGTAQPYEDEAIEFDIRDDGSILVFVGRLTTMWSRPPGVEQKLLLDPLLVAYAHRLLYWAAEVGTRIGYDGAWDIGIAGNGLQDASSSDVETRPRHMLPMERATYPADAFQEVTRATRWDIEHNKGALTDRLIGRVLRAVASSEALRDLAR